ncbi:MAG: esterase [Ectothiorhodospiraceae bacterium AqS1]|nr:esterase [Ectothiorhodospiraceae bacterium AqS1]
MRAQDRIRELRHWLKTITDYMGAGRSKGKGAIDGHSALMDFLDTRSSLVAQTTLYGYLRTRAGMRYPTLFENDAWVGAINHAKWQMWLACLSDISVFAGGTIARRTRDYADPNVAGGIACKAAFQALERRGLPADAGPLFTETAQALRRRLLACRWESVEDGEDAFVESPQALVLHAPIIEELMQLDEEIVRNSVRFRWEEVRCELREKMDADALIESADRG